MKRIVLFLICLLLLLIFSTCNNKKEAEKNITQTSENKIINDEQQQSVSSFNREFLSYNFYTLNLYNEVNYNINKWRLTFLSDNRYEFRSLVEDNFYHIEGSYQIIDNIIKEPLKTISFLTDSPIFQIHYKFIYSIAPIYSNYLIYFL